MQRRIMVACPVYSGKPDFRTVMSIQRMILEGIERGWGVDTYFRTGDSVIQRARNVAVSSFYAMPEYTDLFFIDADIACLPGSFVRMMSHPVDVVGGVYRGRGEPEQYCFRPLPSGIAEACPYSGLWEVEYVPTGFLRITRAAVEKMVKANKDRWFRDPTAPAGLDRIYPLFEHELDVHERFYRSEDYAFCRRYREIGGSVWCDPTLTLHHIGETVFVGNLLEYAMRNKMQAPRSPSTVVEAAEAFLREANIQPERSTVIDAAEMFLRAAQ